MDADKPVIRIYHQHGETVTDAVFDMSLGDLGGILPSVGDCILNPGVRQGLNRNDPANREMWEVRKRVFNPRDMPDYIALVVQARPLHPEEEDFI